MNNHTVISGIIILALIVTGFSVSAQTLSIQQIAESARSSTVFIEVSFHDPNNRDNVCSEKSQGTGFIASQDGHVLSAYHVVEIPTVCREAGFSTTETRGRIGYHLSGEWLPMRLTGRDDFSDAAVLKFPNRAEPYKIAPMCQSRDLSPGTELVAIGFPHGTGYTLVRASYSHSDSPVGDRWVVSSIFTHGMSGGPVYNMQGHVVGFIQGGRENTPAIRYIVPLRAAMTMIDLTGMDLKSCDSSSIEESTTLGINQLRQQMLYSQARQILLDNGWQGYFPASMGDMPKPDDGSMRSRIFHERGYTEVVACSGTGLGLCRFEFNNVHGDKLVIITANNDLQITVKDWKLNPDS